MQLKELLLCSCSLSLRKRSHWPWQLKALQGIERKKLESRSFFPLLQYKGISPFIWGVSLREALSVVSQKWSFRTTLDKRVCRQLNGSTVRLRVPNACLTGRRFSSQAIFLYLSSLQSSATLSGSKEGQSEGSSCIFVFTL